MTQRGTMLVDRYELDEVIGRGGMAEVWRARDTRLGRDVAVKRLRPDLASDPTFQARFRREAQSAANLNHPNIVSVYDTGSEHDPKTDVNVPFIVMELVEGVTLRDVLRDGRKILPERALEFTAGVLDALAYSHRAGIVHRDIKPANVMLTPGGTVKVMDFGIARAVADTSATMTQTAAVIGTAQYLSPEQARGEKVDNRSDIYSAGCLLYELLVGRPPFTGDSPVSVAYQHVRETPVPPSQIDPEITPAMDAITLKALAKNPQDRYQDAKDMAEDIQRALGNVPVSAVLPAAVPATDLGATRVIDPGPATATARRAVEPVPAAVPADEEDDEKKGITGGKIAIGVLIVALLVAAGVALAMLFGGGDPAPTASPSPTIVMKQVPFVVGETSASAQNTLRNAGFEPKATEVESDKPVGEVLETSPKGGEQAAQGSIVNLKVSKGPAPVAIPSGLIGKTEAEAKKALSDLGFAAQTEQVDSDKPAGVVVDTDPKEGTKAAKGSTVTLKVSQGQQAVAVPKDLVGKSKDDAIAALKAAGFKNIDTKASGPVNADKDTVTAVSPDSGSFDPNTQTITLTIASGKSQVPSLTGYTVEKAKEEAQKAGFIVDGIQYVQDNEAPDGTVIDQSPKAQEVQDRGTRIAITVARAATADPSTQPS